MADDRKDQKEESKFEKSLDEGLENLGKDLNYWKKGLLIVPFVILVAAGVLFIQYCCNDLSSQREVDAGQFAHYTDVTFTDEETALINEISKDAVEVKIGTYIENIREISLKDSSFRATVLVWFSWEGPDLDMKNNFRFYRGYNNPDFLEVVWDVHEGNRHYQQVRCDVTFTKGFSSNRFPLESHLLRIYVESHYPLEDVRFVLDEGSGMNENLAVGGFDLVKQGSTLAFHQYADDFGNPFLEASNVHPEMMTAVEINRNSFGLFTICFMGLWATMLWVLLSVFLASSRGMDTLGIIQGSLFPAVANISVGAAFLPSSLSAGLLIYLNLFGILIILVGTVLILTIRHVRESNPHNERFVKYFGNVMFFTLSILVVCGNIMIPLSAYMA